MAEDLRARLERLQALLASLDKTRAETEDLVTQILAEMNERREAEREECRPVPWRPRY